MIGYNGVKFDDTGQNTLASTFLIQLQGQAIRLGLAGGPRHRQARIADEGLALSGVQTR